MTDAKDIDSLRDIRNNARVIVASAAFAEWKRQVDGQIQGRRDELLAPVKSQDELVNQEYMKGEVVGMMHAVKQWELMIAYLDGELKGEEDENPDAQ